MLIRDVNCASNSWARFTSMTTRFGQLVIGQERMRKQLFWMMSALLVLMFPAFSHPAKLVILDDGRQHSNAEEEIRKVADFYGIDTESVSVRTKDGRDRAISFLKRADTAGVASSQAALSALNGNAVRLALRRNRSSSLPMLVFGVSANEDSNQLKFWSGGSLRGCIAVEKDYRPEALSVDQFPQLGRSLAGLDLPAMASPVCGMQFYPAPGGGSILIARKGSQLNPVLIRTETKGAEVFFVPELRQVNSEEGGKASELAKQFSALAPYLLFLSRISGEYGWHLDGHYANLTIDDPWLTQPYGGLDHQALLTEMDKHNFHTTIAFIPWNFDRSEPAVSALYRAHPDRFSICLHGNNHDHREFGDYARNSLAAQIASVKQGVARMERFHALTGVPYDRFMVFPHGVAPEPTFDALRKYNFIGTANSSNIPLGIPAPSDLRAMLRPYTSSYAGLLSYSRQAVVPELSRIDIAIQAYLGNPLLFYGHQNLFAKGPDAFDAVADVVNRVVPDTEWTSLGRIARHTHLLRRRVDEGFDVRMFSSEMELKNAGREDATFYVEREEGRGASTSVSLSIDKKPWAFERVDNLLRFKIVVPAGGTKTVSMSSQNDLNLAHEDIGKGNVYYWALRQTSDFRDLYLGRSSWGRAAIDHYYGAGWNSTEAVLESRVFLSMVTATLTLALAAAWYLRRMRKRKTAKATNQV